MKNKSLDLEISTGKDIVKTSKFMESIDTITTDKNKHNLSVDEVFDTPCNYRNAKNIRATVLLLILQKFLTRSVKKSITEVIGIDSVNMAFTHIYDLLLTVLECKSDENRIKDSLSLIHLNMHNIIALFKEKGPSASDTEYLQDYLNAIAMNVCKLDK